jgi:hypothetical protein
MTKHIPRSARWSKMGPNEHRCGEGRVVFRAGQWFAEVSYSVQDKDSTESAEVQDWVAGRFKRARNAMIAVEDRVTELRRRHGPNVTFHRMGHES